MEQTRDSGEYARMSDAGQPGQLDGWQDYAELKKMLVILGDVVRLNLVHALARLGEVNVTDLAQLLLVSQPLVSWHLSRLRRVGLVRTRRQGRQVYCSLDLERYTRCLGMLAEVVEASGSSTAGVTPPHLLHATAPTADDTPDDTPDEATESGKKASARPDVATAAGRPQARRPRA